MEGLKRIRFMTSHPKDLTDEMISAMARYNNVCHHVHLPMQSGSNEILKRMNRKYTRERYLEIVQKLRATMPDVELTTDIIVGFPGGNGGRLSRNARSGRKSGVCVRVHLQVFAA